MPKISNQPLPEATTLWRRASTAKGKLRDASSRTPNSWALHPLAICPLIYLSAGAAGAFCSYVWLCIAKHTAYISNGGGHPYLQVLPHNESLHCAHVQALQGVGHAKHKFASVLTDLIEEPEHQHIMSTRSQSTKLPSCIFLEVIQLIQLILPALSNFISTVLWAWNMLVFWQAEDEQYVKYQRQML